VVDSFDPSLKRPQDHTNPGDTGQQRWNPRARGAGPRSLMPNLNAQFGL